MLKIIIQILTRSFTRSSASSNLTTYAVGAAAASSAALLYAFNQAEAKTAREAQKNIHDLHQKHQAALHMSEQAQLQRDIQDLQRLLDDLRS